MKMLGASNRINKTNLTVQGREKKRAGRRAVGKDYIPTQCGKTFFHSLRRNSAYLLFQRITGGIPPSLLDQFRFGRAIWRFAPGGLLSLA